MTKDDIFSIVQNNILHVLVRLTPADIQPQISMRALGANSIDRVDVVIKTMQDLGLKIPLVELAGLRNIGELVDFFYQRLKLKKDTG
jgi:polyketide biosynthesis acyl carrier protein